MPVYRDTERTTWYVKLYYTDYTGARKQKMKRGFKLQREAKEWERHFLETLQGTPDMTFGALYELYAADLAAHTKESTRRNRVSLIERHILPFWKDRRLNEITPADVRSWQTEMMNKGLALSTLRTVNVHLSTIFNFACKYYRLPSNPCSKIKAMGKIGRSLNFWTLDEFRQFLPTVQDPILTAAFLTLFYSGIRCGELLALRVKDFDAAAGTITINGTYHRFDREDLITAPKTENSVRTVYLPPFLVDEIRGVIDRIYCPDPEDRIFQTVTSRKLRYAIDTGAAKAGINKIRIHDIRHSHVSLLINMGYQPMLIAERIGDSVEMINKVYGHLYPNQHQNLAEKLQKMKF